jgi:hypothetical protein
MEKGAIGFQRVSRMLIMASSENQNHQELDNEENKRVERAILIFLVILLATVIFVPSELLLKWSMWWNNIK